MAERARLVLIVEDDERTSAFLADNLAADGFGVATATGAAEALRAIEVRQPTCAARPRPRDGHGLQVLDRVRTADGLGPGSTPTCP